jgi:phenylacetate-CoA ligase
MTDTHRTYWQDMDLPGMLADHPIGDDFVRFATQTSRHALRAHQNCLFMRCVERAWATPFYRHLWGEKGIERGDIRSLDDLTKLPIYGKPEIMASLERAPPFGDFAVLEGADRSPVILHTTSGTTGKPQVVLFGPKSREVENLILGRLYRFQGLRPDDVMHSVYGHGMINAGHFVREAVSHWTSSILLPAGTGIETRSIKQVELMQTFGVTVIVGFVDYIKKLATVAREAGIEPGRDIPVRMISGQLGREDRAALSASWGGAECFDWYGVADTGCIAAEGPDRDGLYVMEDAQFLEVCDIETGAPVADGELGDMVCTSLFKDDLYPIIRFNTHDVTRVRPGVSSIGMNYGRIDGFLGRSDNMVKIRGINIFPQAIGPMLDEHPAFAQEFVCHALRTDGRDRFIVTAESHDADPAVAGAFADILKRKIGIEVEVEVVGRGGTAALTEIEARQKPIRLIDTRFK